MQGAGCGVHVLCPLSLYFLTAAQNGEEEVVRLLLDSGEPLFACIACQMLFPLNCRRPGQQHRPGSDDCPAPRLHGQRHQLRAAAAAGPKHCCGLTGH